MPMMRVWVMRVPVHDRIVYVPMGMRLINRIKQRVTVVLIVHVSVLVLDFFVLVLMLMLMLMLMPLSQMQPYAQGHQRCGNCQIDCERLAEEENRDRHADERGCRIVCARARGSDVPQRQNEQHQAKAVTDRADESGNHECPVVGNVDTLPQGEQKVDGAGDQTLHHRDLHGISEGNLAG